MKAVFIETSDFTDWLSTHLPDDFYAKLQQELMDNPERGAVMRGCGGMRKIRTADPKRGKGKRSGARVIYLYIPDAKWFFMFDVYGKDEKDDLSTAEKKVLSQLAGELKKQAKAVINRRTGKKDDY